MMGDADLLAAYMRGLGRRPREICREAVKQPVEIKLGELPDEKGEIIVETILCLEN